MIDRDHALPLARQAQQLDISRAIHLSRARASSDKRSHFSAPSDPLLRKERQVAAGQRVSYNLCSISGKLEWWLLRARTFYGGMAPQTGEQVRDDQSGLYASICCSLLGGVSDSAGCVSFIYRFRAVSLG